MVLLIERHKVESLPQMADGFQGLCANLEGQLAGLNLSFATAFKAKRNRMTGRPMQRTIKIALADERARAVTGLLLAPAGATACYVFAHGAGAGMEHPFMEAVARGLGVRNVATLRYQFPYMEAGSRRPDRPPLAHATVRAAVAAARSNCGALRLFAGGKSFGGRMTSQAQALEPLPEVAGLVFLGFPLHPAGKPGLARAGHLSQIDIPMLFVHGDRDALAEPDLFKHGIGRLAPLASILELKDADHSLHVPRRSGRSDGEVLDEALDVISIWMQAWEINAVHDLVSTPQSPHT